VSGHQAATPKQIARKLVRLLRPQPPDYPYLKKVFQHTRELLEVKPSKAKKRLPELLTHSELVGFYERCGTRATPSHGDG
jgi:integrase/recombinase XerD